jgi:hypothetical protein
MRTITAAELLDAWEAGLGQSPARRALTLLALIWPDASLASLAQITIGERDSQLLALREQLFGSQLRGMAVCPACGDRLELAFGAGQVRAQRPGLPANDVLHLTHDGYDIVFRLPTTADVLALTGADAAEQRAHLLMCCVIGAKGPDGTEVTTGALPAPVADAIAAHMGDADPQADVELSLSCPACGHAWLQPFDIAAYLWTEIADWAKRALREVHALALAYGWSEADILAMSASRRRMYLQMVGA